ncbi:hypothetical protein NUITMVS3_41730 [Shewanella xiamenensis]|nr:hypothetical protein NUITMVS2_36990 [Shewanella xiamenensis]GLD79737.1 hypothetical protein NUITMVS3_41730 [Shewanella xiamenensis]
MGASDNHNLAPKLGDDLDMGLNKWNLKEDRIKQEWYKPQNPHCTPTSRSADVRIDTLINHCVK